MAVKERKRGNQDGRRTGPVITRLQRALGEQRMSKRWVAIEHGEVKEVKRYTDGMIERRAE